MPKNIPIDILLKPQDTFFDTSILTKGESETLGLALNLMLNAHGIAKYTNKKLQTIYAHLSKIYEKTDVEDHIGLLRKHFQYLGAIPKIKI